MGSALAEELRRPPGPVLDERGALSALPADRAVLVGDRVSSSLCALGLRPWVHVVDMRERRSPSGTPTCPFERSLFAQNPPGLITRQAAEAVDEAMSCGSPARVLVEGEEDLLALIAIYLGRGAIVAYGQPGVGIAVVDSSDPRVRALTERALLSMEDGADLKLL
ncbi:MAG: DUF359 domain-containing protein [Conexivisphaera sp.]|jgi:uncharacterized protein (UPF0218 family)|nr:DUF359 domain-containing protein [Conexivisphaerales archaeon]